MQNFTDEDDNGPGPYFAKLTAGMTHFPVNISTVDGNNLEEYENFFLTIDRSSLPCNVKGGNHVQATVSRGDDKCK